MRRTDDSTVALPFPTWSVAPEWLPPGSAIEILTPREDRTSPSLFITPRALMVSEDSNRQAVQSGGESAKQFSHPLGVKRITAVRLIAPTAYHPIEPLECLAHRRILSLDTGAEWAVEVTFDGAPAARRRTSVPTSLFGSAAESQGGPFGTAAGSISSYSI